MKEQLYTIPVNDAFDKDCECPVCEMYHSLETAAIDFTMGPSYMEDDVRMETDKIGFCADHIKLLYQNQNRLGLGLMLLSHLDNSIKEIEKAAKNGKPSKNGLFKKKEGTSLIKGYIDKLEHSCYICNRMNRMFERYIITFFYLYHNDESFRKKFEQCKGFCAKHYALFYEVAPNHLNGKETEEFIETLNKLYLDNMKRIRDELEWFTDKFDYRYANEPWKNSKDALPRTIQKVNSVWVE